MYSKNKLTYFFLLIFYLKIGMLYSFELEIYMHVTDQREIKFPDGNKYVQLEGSANWKDTQGDYGVINCLATITTTDEKKLLFFMPSVKEKTKIRKNFG